MSDDTHIFRVAANYDHTRNGRQQPAAVSTSASPCDGRLTVAITSVR